MRRCGYCGNKAGAPPKQGQTRLDTLELSAK
ncbi:hypothetical protein DFR97_000007 [Clostridium beijerinckii]|nr:hypothetical protein [Clostridium beijerinckii]